MRAAQANANALRGTLFPLINASFDASRQQTPGATLTSNVPSGADTYSLHTPQVSVAFVPDVFGGTRRAVVYLGTCVLANLIGVHQHVV